MTVERFLGLFFSQVPTSGL
uniref:Uncharacterized protein n=1 Tax=Rhizophora mucronata TaxID=61149 RepID=A0A2P2NST9_RHIMU